MRYILIENYNKEDFCELWCLNTIDITAKDVATLLIFRGIPYDQIHSMPNFDNMQVELPDRTRIKWVTPKEEVAYQGTLDLAKAQMANYPNVIQRINATVH